MIIEQLIKLRANGEFNHATYRTERWCEGWFIYYKSETGFRGFSLAGSFSAHDPLACDYVYNMVRSTGYSVGSYGQG